MPIGTKVETYPNHKRGTVLETMSYDDTFIILVGYDDGGEEWYFPRDLTKLKD